MFVKTLIVLGFVALITLITFVIAATTLGIHPIGWLSSHLRVDQRLDQNVSEGFNNWHWNWVTGSSNSIKGATINNTFNTPERVIEKITIIHDQAPTPAPSPVAPQGQQTTTTQGTQVWCNESTPASVVTSDVSDVSANVQQPSGALISINAGIPDYNSGCWVGGCWQPYYFHNNWGWHQRNFEGSRGYQAIRSLPRNVCTGYNRNWANPTWSQGGNGNYASHSWCPSQGQTSYGGGRGSHSR